MKRTFAIWMAAALGALVIALSGCQKAPELTLSGPATVELSADGSAGSITFTANREWMIAASDSWVHVSPASGAASDTPVTVSVSCDPNTTYEDRSSTVVIKAEGLSQSVTVKQPANLGLIVPQGDAGINLPAGAQTFEVEVQANVSYTVSISADWVKQTGTKALTSNKLTFSAEENTTYDERSATITLSGSGLSQTVTVRQAAKPGIELEKTEFEAEAEESYIEIPVKTNVELTVTPAADWITFAQTKALENKTVVLHVSENPDYQPRECRVEISGGGQSRTITVRQAAKVVRYLNITSLQPAGNAFTATWETNLPEGDYYHWSIWYETEKVEDGVMISAYGELPFGVTSLDATNAHQSREYNQTVWIEPLQPGGTIYHFTLQAYSGTYEYHTLLKTAEATFASLGSSVPEGAVDLGLSVYWASCNLGAGKPEEAGDYYAWAETATKDVYNWKGYKYHSESDPVTKADIDPNGEGQFYYLTKYNWREGYGVIDNKKRIDPDDDAATKILGGKWRMPTVQEISELWRAESNLQIKETELNGVKGRLFTSNNTGEAMFLPYAGSIIGNYGVKGDGVSGKYWTQNLYTPDGPNEAIYLEIDSASVTELTAPRCIGLPIRPVCDKE